MRTMLINKDPTWCYDNPLNDATEVKISAEEQQVVEDGQKGVSRNVYFIQQTVGNACGTAAILHASGLNSSKIQKSSYLQTM